jgi:uncharacterized protein
MKTSPIDLIDELILPGTELNAILVSHSRAVAAKAISIAENLSNHSPDLDFIEEAALLHDIGIFLTHAPVIGCKGTYPYISHGYLGRGLLEERGLFRHALVCERHVGVGLSVDDIREQRLSLPERDMRPESLEEEIICYADKFFSKKWQQSSRPLSFSSACRNIARYGPDKLSRFLAWKARFENSRSLTETGERP